MFSSRLIYPFIVTIIFARSVKVFAFDPVTVAMTAQTAQSAMGQMDEAADIGFSMFDLLSELGIETDSEKDLQTAVDRISQMNSQARDLKWSSDDLKRSLTSDLNNGQSLSRRIKSLRNAAQTSKKIASIMGFRPKAAEKAVRIQEIKLDSMILEELQSIRRAQYLAYLEDKEASQKRKLFIEQILEQEEGRKTQRGRP